MTKQVIVADTQALMQRDGLTDQVQPWEDGRRVGTTGSDYEWWYFDARLDDGSSAIFTYATKFKENILGKLEPTLVVWLTRPDGSRLQVEQAYPWDRYRAATDRCDVRLGPNWARGDLHVYQIHAEESDLSADLEFVGLVPPWRPGAGKDYLDPELKTYFAWLSAIPYGEVKGTLTYDGQTRHVHGTGYHDHNWGNVAMQRVLAYWYWGRAHVGDFTLVFAWVVAGKAYGFQQLPLLMVARGERILVGGGSGMTLDTGAFHGPPAATSYPDTLGFRWRGSDGTVDIALRRPVVMDVNNPLDNLPLWQRLLAGLFARPRYYRFTADLTLSVDVRDVRATEQGSALYEIMVLR